MKKSVQCTAHSKRTKLRCQKQAIMGATVCRFHGGASPQVKAAAAERLKSLQDPALVALEDALAANAPLLVGDGMGEQHVEYRPDHSTRLRASTAVLDRTGLGPTKRLDIGGTDGPPVKLVIGIDEDAV